MTSLDAVMIIEDGGADYMEILSAWSHLIRTGEVWTLQGFYGRTAQALIDSGTIAPNGEILAENV